MTFLDTFFNILYIIDDFYWSYVGFILITILGIYLTIKTKGFQFRILLTPKKSFLELYHDAKDENQNGIHPFKLYFTSIGGMIGLGSLVSVVTVTTIGGPGGIFWLWIASFAGMLIKYSEVFLGVTYRVPNAKKGYDGGSMYYLQAAFNNKYLSVFVCILFCIYSVEIYQFNILTEVVKENFHIDKKIVIACLILIIIYSAIGGVKRFSSICATLMPIFLILYVSMCSFVIFQNFAEFIKIIPLIFKSAFEGHAALGGFAGASMLIAAKYGTQRAVYSGDIGIGYDSIMQSETKVKMAERQAKIAIFSLLSSAIISTFTSLIILVTGFWKIENKLLNSEYVEAILSNYFPYVNIFMFILIVLSATTTIIGFLVVGIKSAKYIHPKLGSKIYLLYALIAFPLFSYCDQSKVITIMTFSGGLLMMCNLFGIFKLRNKIKFK